MILTKKQSNKWIALDIYYISYSKLNIANIRLFCIKNGLNFAFSFFKLKCLPYVCLAGDFSFSVFEQNYTPKIKIKTKTKHNNLLFSKVHFTKY